MTHLDNDQMLLALQQSLTKKRVLLIDRHAPARDALRLMLSNLGVTQVHGAGNSAEVIRQVKGNQFDIILSDFVLDDGRDGQQLLEELRHNHLISLSTMYMIITSERAYTNVVALAELAPDDYLIKPFTSEQLLSRLIKALYRKHILHRIYAQIEKGALAKAVQACDQIITGHPAFIFDALRFKGELLLTLGQIEAAEAVYQQVLKAKAIPWAQMGLAMTKRAHGAFDEASAITESLLKECPQFLAAYDFLASLKEQQGEMAAAQVALQRGADASPYNTLRQRLVGDFAMRNEDYLTAEKAYAKVVSRNKGSSLRQIDDMLNLSRSLLERQHIDDARKIIGEMKREWRGDRQAELAGSVMEALCYHAENLETKAAEATLKALEIEEQLSSEAKESQRVLSPRIMIDLAHACYATGEATSGHRISRKVAAEHHEDKRILDRIQRVFEKTGQTADGKTLLDDLGKEIIELNNQGVRAARQGDLEGSVKLLIQAVEKVPSLQFLLNASKAMCTLMNQSGWREDLAAKLVDYLQRAQKKDRKNANVAATKEFALTVAKKYGILLDL